ncbi:MAG: hypothetical protein DHS20C18_28440 [Saprospiraceae bacterium]|nr:MAG: hypothetical protein DHS20C18_28440 [Saprospiraceae bacterium]
MQQKTTFIIGLTLGLIVYACSPRLNPGISSLSLVEKLNAATSSWESITSQAPESYEFTWIPDLGVRGRYQMAKSVLSKKMVEAIVGEKAFLSGPHTDEINYSSATAFGHYNPKFLTQLHKVLENTYHNKTFVAGFQSFYDQELKGYLRTFYLTYEAGINNEPTKTGYLSRIAQPVESRTDATDDPSFYLQEAFRSVADAIESQGYDWYEGATCPSFWLRRSIDGTADEFHDLLILTLKTFDRDFLKK